MMIEAIKKIAAPFIVTPIVNFKIEKSIFNGTGGRKTFNQVIRAKVEKKFGIYAWVIESTGEVVYIGMAGRIKANGTFGGHSIKNRLVASRGKHKITKKDIQTNDYVGEFVIKNNIEVLNLYIMYSKSDEPPSYIEALLLYKYFKRNNRLPKLNHSF